MSESSKFYLFALKNGKAKLAYGRSPEEALTILARRLTPTEMSEIDRDNPRRITQQTMQQHIGELG